MPGISTSQLSAMRQQGLDYLPDSGTILTKTQTSDGQGGYTESWSGTVSTDCRVDVVNGREQLQGGGYQTFQKTMLTLPYSGTITTNHRFAYGSNQYNVVAVSRSDRSWNIFVRAELEKV
jgi:SPP1 family predicted phage head-tail adaptor